VSAEETDLLRQLAAKVDGLAAEVVRLRERLPPQLVTIDKAAELLGVSRSTIKRKVAAGEIRARHVGRSVRVDVSDYAKRAA
jgi:excisionase family DNA binding protein